VPDLAEIWRGIKQESGRETADPRRPAWAQFPERPASGTTIANIPTSNLMDMSQSSYCESSQVSRLLANEVSGVVNRPRPDVGGNLRVGAQRASTVDLAGG